MASRRVLIAAQPEASRMLQTMLAGIADVVPVHTTAEALKILQRERIDLIISTIAFDESQMLEFLQAVKRTGAAGQIPFLCTRVLPSVIRDSLVTAMRDACMACGAVDLVDIARLPSDRAGAAMRDAVKPWLK